MLTGDNADTARTVAAHLGIDRVMAGVLPDGKAAAIVSLQRQGHRVAMIGDGINDAPAQALIVEADITASPPLTSADEAQTPLRDRLSASHYDRVGELSEEYHFDLAALDALPAWHVALLLQSRQAERLGLRADYGIDYQLIQAARANDQPIIELEGPEEQLGLLRRLPDQGAALLADTLTR